MGMRFLAVELVWINWLRFDFRTMAYSAGVMETVSQGQYSL